MSLINRPKISKVGLIGVGVMGRVILEKLLENGFETYASDPSKRAQEFVKEKGATLLSSPAEIAGKVDVILLSLPKPQHVKAVVSGEDGLLGYIREGQVIVDLSTVDPQTAISMSMLTEDKGVGFLDAPILGRPVSIGRWLLPIGGKVEDLEYVRPVLSTFAYKTPLIGKSGAGHTLKLLNQLMFSTINGISCEVMAIAKKAGLDLSAFYDTVSNSGAATVSGLFCEVARKIVENEYDDAVFTVDLLCKDSGLGLEMAKSFNSPSIIAEHVHTFNEITKSVGLGNQDTSAVFKLLCNIYKDQK